jgi:IS1 family transposase
MKALAYGTQHSRTANSLRVGLNSARLLVTILLAGTLLLTAAAGITAAWSSSFTESIDDFQYRYSTKLSLTQELADLKEQEQQFLSQQGRPRQTAAAISSFCQKSFSNLFLTDLSVVYSEDDRMIVEARGSAKREGSVFALRDHLEQLVAPSEVTVNSIRPQQRNVRGGADSLFTFSLSVTTDD